MDTSPGEIPGFVFSTYPFSITIRPFPSTLLFQKIKIDFQKKLLAKSCETDLIQNVTSKPHTMKNSSSLETFNYEYTDTFSGEANYSWVKRGTVKADSFDKALRLAKKELQMTGVHGKKEKMGDSIKFTPYRSNTVLFIS